MTTVLGSAFTEVSGLRPIGKKFLLNTLPQNRYLRDICITCAKLSDIAMIKIMTSAWCRNQNTLFDLQFTVVGRN